MAFRSGTLAGKGLVLRLVVAVLALSFAAIIFLAACGGEKEEPTPADQTPAAGETPAEEAATPEEEAEDEEEGAAAGGVDPCALVTKEEVQETLGEPVGEPQKLVQKVSEDSGLASCRYDGQSEDAFVMADIVVAPSQEAATEAFQTSGEHDQLEEVSGIGDQAFWEPEFSILHVLKGSVWLTIDGQNAQTEALGLEALKPLAEAAAGRLP